LIILASNDKQLVAAAVPTREAFTSLNSTAFFSNEQLERLEELFVSDRLATPV